MTMFRRLRLVLTLVVAVAAGAVATVSLTPPPAGAESTTTGNPWTFTETSDQAEGLRINAAEGANGQPLIVYDYLNQPIFAVNRAGGAAVFGDDFRVLRGDDIYHGQTTLSADNPNPAVCVRNGQLWIGGVEGHAWRCADLGGGYGWWQVW